MGFGVATWIAMGPAIADDPTPNDTSKTDTMKNDKSMSMSRAERKSMTANVVRVDTTKRHLVLQGEDGKEMTLQVPESVKRLDEIKPGDKIKVDYYSALGISLNKGGEAGGAERTMTERNKGKLPSGTIAHQESGTVEIVKIDKDKNQLTVKRPNGDMDTIDIKDPDLQSKLGDLKEGDKVQATYTEAAAITVQRENKGQNRGRIEGQNEKMPNEPNKTM
jgi:Cu/Ag efflux protein CusF